MSRERVTACILAGGRGRRMGGIDKGLMLWHGRPLVEQLVEALSPQVDRIVINANRNQETYRRLGHSVIGDELAGYQGPLAGIAAGLAAAGGGLLAVLPCDAPNLPPDYIERLCAARRGAPIAVAHDGLRLQPVHALLPVDLLPELREFLAGGGRKVEAWYARQGFARADFSDRRETFFNLNRPEDRRLASLDAAGEHS